MKIVNISKLNNEIEKYIKDHCDVYISKKGKELCKEDLYDADVIIGNVNKELLVHSKSLKYLQLDSAGNDPYLDVTLPKGCVMCNASGTFGELISEHLLMVTFMLFRNMPYYIQNQNHHIYKKLHQVKSIKNARFLILGTGDLGSKFAEKLKKLGAYTMGVKRTKVNSLPFFDEVYTIEKLDELLPTCDVLCMCLPKSKNTDNMIDKNKLSLMKKDSFVINVGRSNAIDNHALCHLLNTEQIQGAALDVFDIEPIPKDDEIWNTKNLIITPHVSGTFANEITYDLFYDILMNNLKRFFNHETLINIVDIKEGY